MTKKKQPGTLLRVDLEDGYRTYGRVLESPFVAFYDARTTEELDAQEITFRPVLFVLAVSAGAIDTWETIGHVPLEPAEIPIPELFRQNIADPSDIEIVNAEGKERSATYEEVKDMERSAVWLPRQCSAAYSRPLRRPTKHDVRAASSGSS
ncbi:MAG: immunity 26/phosphotriesterase HocA family protein [Persicimonas sp.]